MLKFVNEIKGYTPIVIFNKKELFYYFDTKNKDVLCRKDYFNILLKPLKRFFSNVS